MDRNGEHVVGRVPAVLVEVVADPGAVRQQVLDRDIVTDGLRDGVPAMRNREPVWSASIAADAPRWRHR